MDDKEKLIERKVEVGQEIRDLKEQADTVAKEETALKSSRIEVGGGLARCADFLKARSDLLIPLSVCPYTLFQSVTGNN